MDTLLFSQSLSNLACLFIFFIIFFKLIISLTKKSIARNLPPGPWKLPLIGNIHNLFIGGSVPHRALHKLSLEYGAVMHLQLGEISTVIISSPEAAKQVMKTHDINFASRPPTIATDIITHNTTGISFSPYGDYWRQLRKICTVELLSMRRVQSFRSMRETVLLDLARWLASQEGSPVNLTEKLYTSAYALISRTALGKNNEVKEAFLHILKEVIELASGFNVADLYPSSKLLQMTSDLYHFSCHFRLV